MPAALEAATLPEALAEVAARLVRAQRRSRSRSTVTGEVDALHPEIEVALLRTAQEALANVGQARRRAHASA